MEEYDVVVIGSGSGSLIVDEVLAHDLSVALIDKGPLGGTCLNLGCIPSKMLIYVADKIMEIQDTRKLGIDVQLKAVDFNAVMERMRKLVQTDQEAIRESIKELKGLDLYEATAHFVEDYTLEVDGQQMKGNKIFIASGSRPLVPPIKGLNKVDYLTSESVLQLKERPESLIIIGGGYIGVEFAHFFSAMGTKVTVLEMTNRLVAGEEAEVSELLKRELSKRMDVFTGVEAEQVKAGKGGVTVVMKDRQSGAEREINAQKLMVAVGRVSNADLLKPEKSGIELDERGFIKVNENLETTKKDIYAVGDAIGQHMFTHVANREAMIAIHNALHGGRLKMDYDAVPHAVFSYPQIASIGLTEAAAKARKFNVAIGYAKYSEVAYGQAMMEENGFAKAVVDVDNNKILGFHIIGPYAAILLQEVTNAMSSDGHVESINAGLHIHPALPELIDEALSNLMEA